MQVASVTDLTLALENVTDVKHITGDLVNNLHAAEKHIRKNKLKVCPHHASKAEQRKLCPYHRTLAV